MKTLEELTLSLPRCREELAEFKKLLDGKAALSERADVLPFFKKHKHLAALVGSYNPRINGFDRIATEFSLFGDYACDLVIGDSVSHNFCFVEFEDASPNSVFTRKKSKVTPEWSQRFDRGFSQILDWFCILEDQRRTPQFKARFGAEVIQYVGLLVIGRRHYLDDAQYDRMRWRSEQVQVGARQVNCITYDELLQTLALKVSIFG
ncbi:MAG: Shedu immune nuclease family protein [Isosphaeraceae bacterium]